MSAHVLEGTFMAALWQALNAPGRAMRIERVNSGVFVKRDARGQKIGVIRGARFGTADLIGIAGPDGLYFEVECKSATGRQSPRQRVRQRMIEAHGGLYVLAKYDDATSLDVNVARVVRDIDDALALRRGGGALRRLPPVLTRVALRESDGSRSRLSPHAERRVAVLAGCDPRTVQTYLDPARRHSVRGTTAARIEEALARESLAGVTA